MTLPSAGKLQRGVVTGLDNPDELGVFGSLEGKLVVRMAAHCFLEPVCARAGGSPHNPFTSGIGVQG